MSAETSTSVVREYLDRLDAQRESALAALDGIPNAQLWQRPAPKEWSIGEILDHNYLLIASMLPVVERLWKFMRWYGAWRRQRPYATVVEDVYRDPKFPQWVGFLWTPRYNTRKPVAFDVLSNELRELHAKVRRFYTGKDENVLGNLYLFDPVFGWCNLIVTLRISIYHDQLHYEDIYAQVKQLQS